MTKKKLTPKQRVLKKFPNASCREVSGCTFAVFSCEVVDTSTLLGMAHSQRGAWAAAARDGGDSSR